MSVDRQLPLEPTERIDPSTQVDRMPGCDAICLCDDTGDPWWACGWPFCDCYSPTEEDDV